MTTTTTAAAAAAAATTALTSVTSLQKQYLLSRKSMQIAKSIREHRVISRLVYFFST